MTYRNKKLLEVVREAPCMSCGIEDGTVCAAHSNQQRDGKGMAEKAHDFRISALCSACHFMIDNDKTMKRNERIDLWEAAHRKTIAWLFENDKVKLK
jgi:hypothetical protein